MEKKIGQGINWKIRLKRIGIWGLLFFLLKGLLWLAAGYWVFQ